MATVNVTATAQALTANEPNAVVDLAFTYSGSTVQNGTTIYFGAHLSDGTNTEDALFPMTVTTGTAIPASADFSYTPGVAFSGTITPTLGKVYYTA